MKFGVVVFPGSNCDQDSVDVLGNILGQEVVKLWHKDHDLQQCDFIILPGGFSFGDYLRSGAIARFSPIMQEVIQFANKGGYVMGICNGFQILAEAGLVPGALLHNDHRKFNCKNIFLKPQTLDSLVTNQLGLNKALKIPVAHGEGNYFADADTLKMLNDQDQILFKYCDEAGNISLESNPNGSIQNIAGVCNKQRNVFGLMPHPERAADSLLGNQDGLGIFESILKTVDA
ncbi:Phosphoribosylformylglycinamidine synthase, glutamine amidotransferase subunit [Arcticibacter svalbardensis MN12-7]|uniref:Phosphoribosylformylglycinamidine synthase subunit PurQ n=1 Tax=Arcticibacter svalbardensis MN12-7 TaxID=1150600 RepID=R9GUY6_9SPHI|nr:phosphoribosylformylglycinamidine synthase subunit PurQ [Arcticibacter svalbardensis]EOR95340.1 Phosphoribosylformylglycinamidine synthase, glutamine amidotransferase subunit [Arcticibacter svalbardensis MN12-7]